MSFHHLLCPLRLFLALLMGYLLQALLTLRIPLHLDFLFLHFLCILLFFLLGCLLHTLALQPFHRHLFLFLRVFRLLPLQRRLLCAFSLGLVQAPHCSDHRLLSRVSLGARLAHLLVGFLKLFLEFLLCVLGNLRLGSFTLDLILHHVGCRFRFRRRHLLHSFLPDARRAFGFSLILGNRFLLHLQLCLVDSLLGMVFLHFRLVLRNGFHRSSLLVRGSFHFGFTAFVFHLLREHLLRTLRLALLVLSQVCDDLGELLAAERCCELHHPFLQLILGYQLLRQRLRLLLALLLLPC